MEVAVPLAKNILGLLRITAASLAFDEVIEKNHCSGRTILII